MLPWNCLLAYLQKKSVRGKCKDFVIFVQGLPVSTPPPSEIIKFIIYTWLSIRFKKEVFNHFHVPAQAKCVHFLDTIFHALQLMALLCCKYKLNNVILIHYKSSISLTLSPEALVFLVASVVETRGGGGGFLLRS